LGWVEDDAPRRARENHSREPRSSGMTYSQLSNGHLFPALLAIGSVVQTQWGPRSVVGHVSVPLAVEPTPTTAWGEPV
jgi:hypothetical protein